jgi:hypothetical protein
MLDAQDFSKLKVVYKIPSMEEIKVKQWPYKKSGDGKMMMDIYYPHHIKNGSEFPAVVFIFGYSDNGMKKMMGSKSKDLGCYTSWAKLVAASGMAAILYETKDPWLDTQDLLKYINQHAEVMNINEEKMCLWSCSGNVPTALSILMGDRNKRIKCTVLYYGIMSTPDRKYKKELDSLFRQFKFSIEGVENIKNFHKDLPFFIVRAGLDKIPRLNEMTNHFILQAITHNVPITLINYTNGRHAFDLLDDNVTSRNIIKQTIEFMKYHLQKNKKDT